MHLRESFYPLYGDGSLDQSRYPLTLSGKSIPWTAQYTADLIANFKSMSILRLQDAALSDTRKTCIYIQNNSSFSSFHEPYLQLGLWFFYRRILFTNHVLSTLAGCLCCINKNRQKEML